MRHLFFLLLANSLFGYQVNWNDLVWADPSSNSYNNISGSGIGLTISVTGGSLLTGSPSISDSGLSISTDFNNRSQSISIVFTFSAPIQSLTLGLSSLELGPAFNPSRYQYQDLLFGIGGVGDYSVSVVAGSGNSFSGGALIGTDSVSSPSYITWEGLFTEASFSFGVGPDSRNNPQIQQFEINEVIFVIPEVSQIFPLLAFFLIFLLTRIKKPLQSFT
jgi:hypothetical protein